MQSEKKNFIPATNPSHRQKLPEGYTNSLVDTGGQKANTYNDWAFDEKDDEVKEENSEQRKLTYDDLGKEVKFNSEANKE